MQYKWQCKFTGLEKMFMLEWFQLMEKISIKDMGVLKKWNRNYVFSKKTFSSYNIPHFLYWQK